MNESKVRNLARASSSFTIEPRKLTLPMSNHHQDSSSNFSQAQQISDLEWDKELDFVCKAESDTMSDYDLNERVQELLRQRILEFEMLSMTESVKNLSLFDQPESELNDQIGSNMEMSPVDFSSAASLLTSADCLTIDDIFKLKHWHSSRISSPLRECKPFFYSPITFDIESSFSLVNNANSDHVSNSMPDLSIKTNKLDKIRMIAKHKSLLDLSNFKCTYIKRKDSLKKQDSGSKLDSSLPRLSRLQTIKLYINRLSEKVRTIIRDAFSNRRKSSSKANQLYPIREESYDIIDLDSSILKQ